MEVALGALMTGLFVAIVFGLINKKAREDKEANRKTPLYRQMIRNFLYIMLGLIGFAGIMFAVRFAFN